MSETNTKLDIGKIINFSSGEYSNYGYVGNVVALKSFDLKDALEDFEPAFAAEQALRGLKSDYLDDPSPQDFVAWLCAHSYVVEIEAREVHLGSYGDIEL